MFIYTNFSTLLTLINIVLYILLLIFYGWNKGSHACETDYYCSVTHRPICNTFIFIIADMPRFTKNSFNCFLIYVSGGKQYFLILLIHLSHLLIQS